MSDEQNEQNESNGDGKKRTRRVERLVWMQSVDGVCDWNPIESQPDFGGLTAVAEKWLKDEYKTDRFPEGMGFMLVRVVHEPRVPSAIKIVQVDMGF